MHRNYYFNAFLHFQDFYSDGLVLLDGNLKSKIIHLHSDSLFCLSLSLTHKTHSTNPVEENNADTKKKVWLVLFFFFVI